MASNSLAYISLLALGALDLLLSIGILANSDTLDNPALLFLAVKFATIVIISSVVRFKMDKPKISDSVLIFFTIVLTLFYSMPGVLALFYILDSGRLSQSKQGKLYHIDQEEGEVFAQTETDDTIPFEELIRVSPLVDGLTDDDKNNRIATVLAMEHMIDSTTIRKALIQSQSDPHKEVQYFVNGALSKVSENCLDKIKKQLDILNNANPDYENYKKLADLYAYIADANIEHPLLVEFYYKEAEKYYRFIMEKYPTKTVEIHEKLIPVIYAQKAYAECIHVCDKVMEVPELRSLSYLYKLRSLFSLRKLDDMQKIAASTDLGALVAKDNLLFTISKD